MRTDKELLDFLESDTVLSVSKLPTGDWTVDIWQGDWEEAATLREAADAAMTAVENLKSNK